MSDISKSHSFPSRRTLWDLGYHSFGWLSQILPEGLALLLSIEFTLKIKKGSFSAKKKRPDSIMAELATQQTRWQGLSKTTPKYEYDSTWVTLHCHITKLQYDKLDGALHTNWTSSPSKPFENVFPNCNEAWLIMTQLIIVCKSFQLTSWSIVRAGFVHMHPKKFF